MPDTSEFYIRAVNHAIERDSDDLACELAEVQGSTQPRAAESPARVGRARRLMSAANHWTLVSFNPPWSRRQDAA